MAPAVTIDNTPDFDFTTPAKSSAAQQRTLLLAPPSVSSHPEALTRVAEAYDRNATDIQMLDRLAMGLVALPAATYDVVLLLTDVDGSRRESSLLLTREVMERIVPSLKVGGRLKSQDGSFGAMQSAEQTEGILAGLVRRDADGMVKPEPTTGGQTVQLSFGKKKANAAAVPANGMEAVNTAKRKIRDSEGVGMLAQSNERGLKPARATPAGVGFVDSNDDFDGGFDDGSGYQSEEDDLPTQEELERAERIDPDTLLTAEDRMKPLNIREWRTNDFLDTVTKDIHSRSMQTEHEKAARLQRLHLWSCPADRGRRQSEASECRCQPCEAQRERSDRSRLHCARQSRILWELCTR